MDEKHVSTNITDLSPILINIKDSPDIIQASELSPKEFQSVGNGIAVITLGKDIDGNIIYSDSLKKWRSTQHLQFSKIYIKMRKLL